MVPASVQTADTRETVREPFCIAKQNTIETDGFPMKEYHIINPAAGHGMALDAAKKQASPDAILYITTGVGDARRYLAETLSGLDEDVRVYVWGGDGTIGEAVSGIMDANAAAHAILTACPAGTGNDFVKVFADVPKGTELRLDLLFCGDRYVLNMINIGFDCAVADRMSAWKKKPLIRGSMAYFCAIAEVFFRPLGTPLTICYTDESGEEHTVSGSFLLSAIANGQFCGGGFRGAPTADLSDGTAELIMVDEIPRSRIMSLIGLYRVGKHVDEMGQPVAQISDVLRYVRCRRVRISGMKIVCLDGEIVPGEEIDISILPGALRYMV